MTLDDMLLRAHPGEGVVARFPGVILVVSPESARQEAATDQLLSLAEAAAMNGPTPGRRLARQVAGVLAGDPDDLPPFGLLAQGDTGLVMILQGAMDAEVSGPGGSEHLSGSQVATWVDRILPDTTQTVVVTPHGRQFAEPSPRSRLVAGVIAGGGASLRAAGLSAGVSASAGAAPVDAPPASASAEAAPVGTPLASASAEAASVDAPPASASAEAAPVDAPVDASGTAMAASGVPMAAEAPMAAFEAPLAAPEAPMAASGVPMAAEAAVGAPPLEAPATPMSHDAPMVGDEVPPAMVPPYEPPPAPEALPDHEAAMASPEAEAAAAEAPMVAEELVAESPPISEVPMAGAAAEEPAGEAASPVAGEIEAPPAEAASPMAAGEEPAGAAEAPPVPEAGGPMAGAESEAAMAGEQPPVPEAEGAAGKPSPVGDPSLGAVSRPAPGHAAPPTPLSRPLQDALEGPGAMAVAEPESSPEQPIAAEAESPTALAEEQGPRVRGAMCPNGHFNDPAAPFCAVCGVSMANRTLNLVEGPRPPLGVLIFDGGGTCLLDTDYVVGREPENDPTVASGGAAPLILEDPDRTVSRIHARFVIDGWTVRVIDAGSANGTFIAPPAEEAWIPLTPNTPTAITPGTRIRLGQRVVLFDSHQRTS